MVLSERSVEGVGRPDVAFILPALEAGGVERVYLDLASGLLTKGLAVDFVLAKAEGAFLPQVPEGARLVDLGLPRRLRLLRAYGPLRTYLVRERPRVALPVWGYMDAVPLEALRREKVSALWVLHSSPTYLLDLPSPKREAARLAALWALKRASRSPRVRLGAVSRGVARAFARLAGVPEEVFRILPNPIPLERVRRLAQEPLPSLPFSFGAPFFLGVGRLHPNKGWDLILQAFARFLRWVPKNPFHLLILGEGGDRQVLENLVRELGLTGRVWFLGHSPNPYAYMLRAKALVMASRYEGLPTVALEALALGLPVIATESEGGLGEALGEGKFGLLVPRNPESLAEGMVRFLREGFPLDGEALAAHLSRFTLEASLEAYLRTFEELWS